MSDEQIADDYAEQSQKCREQADHITELREASMCPPDCDLTTWVEVLAGSIESAQEAAGIIAEQRQQIDDGIAGVKQAEARVVEVERERGDYKRAFDRSEEAFNQAQKDFNQAIAQRNEAREQLKTANAVVERLPKDTEGNRKIPAIDTVWHPAKGECDVICNGKARPFDISYYPETVMVSDCYSTEAAAREAAGKE